MELAHPRMQAAEMAQTYESPKFLVGSLKAVYVETLYMVLLRFILIPRSDFVGDSFGSTLADASTIWGGIV